MKTFTLLFLLFAAAFTGFGQTEIFYHTFDSDTQGWYAAASTATVSWESDGAGGGYLKLETTANNDRAAYDATITGAGEYTLTFKVMTTTAGTVKMKPLIRQFTSNISGDVIKLTGGGTWDDYSYTFTLEDGDDDVNIRLQEIAPDNTATYYFDDVKLIKEPCDGYAVTTAIVGGGTVTITNPLPCYPEGTDVEFTANPSSHWVFDSWSGDLTGTTNPASITVGTTDVTVTANFVTESGFDYKFLFDTDNDTEGWEPVNGTIEGPASGILTFTPTAEKYAKLTLPNFPVPADNYNFLTIKVKNNSQDNELQFITSLGRTKMAITTSDATEQTYEIQLDTVGTWDGSATWWAGTAENITFRFGDAETGLSTGTGTFEINSIEFSTVATRISKHASYALTLSPNPSTGNFNLNSENPVMGYTIFNITGQIVKQVTGMNTYTANVDLSGADKGIYFVKVTYLSGKTQVVRALVK